MRLALVGDVMLGRLVNEHLQTCSPNYPWGNTLPLIRNADWRACNLECVISNRGAPWSLTPKAFHFRSDAKNIAVLKAARIDAVSLANNHTLDFNYDAMFEMLRILDAASIAHRGAGKNMAEASAPVFSHVREKSTGKSLRIGFLAFTDNEEPWEALPQRPGVWFVPIDPEDPRARALLEIVSKTKARSDLMVLSAHWGPNWGYAPPSSHIEFAHALIEAGADIVFGHSAHIARGIELYHERPILYSTGDFIDDYAVDEIERNDQSFVFVIETEGPFPRRLTLYPTVIRNFQARQADGPEAKQIMARMIHLCENLGTSAMLAEDEKCLKIDLPPGGNRSVDSPVGATTERCPPAPRQMK